MADKHMVQIVIEFPTQYPSGARAHLMAARYKAELEERYPQAVVEDHIWTIPDQ